MLRGDVRPPAPASVDAPAEATARPGLRARWAAVLAKYGKFAVVGATGVVVNLVLFTLVLLVLYPNASSDPLLTAYAPSSSSWLDPVLHLVASAVAFVVATLWNFTFNNLWTFRSGQGHRHGLRSRLALYYGVSLGSLAVNEVVLFALGFAFPPIDGQLAGILAGSVVGFAGNDRVTFVESPPTVAGPPSAESDRRTSG